MLFKKTIHPQHLASQLLDISESWQLDELFLKMAEDLGLSLDYFFSFGPQFEIKLFKYIYLTLMLVEHDDKRASIVVPDLLEKNFTKLARREWNLDQSTIRDEWNLARKGYGSAMQSGDPDLTVFTFDRILRVDAAQKNPRTVAALQDWLGRTQKQVLKELRRYKVAES